MIEAYGRNRRICHENLSDYELERKIRQIDKVRAASYSIVTQYPWGDKHAYHLCINTTGIDIPEIIPYLAELVEFRQKG